MAGAWNSEYFEREKPAAGGPMPVQANPGVQDTPPPMYNVSKQGGSGSKMVAFLLLPLRTLTFVFGLITLAILAADKASYLEGNSDFTVSQHDVKFTVFVAYKFLLSAAVIVCFYSLCQMILTCVILCIASSSSGNVVLALITFICDQCLAYLLMGASAASATVAMISRRNYESLYYQYSCSDLLITKFCTKAEVSVAMGFVAFLFLAITAAITARQLFRLF